jgi:uncharacterized membrane protein (UPF0127 family)
MSKVAILKKNQEVIASEVTIGDCFFKRLIGLTNRKEMQTHEGFLLKPCSQIHTYNMSFPIDAVFISKDGEIIHIEHNLISNRISKYIKEAETVLELSVNSAKEKDLQIGDKIEFVSM